MPSFLSAPPPTASCDMLKGFSKPTLVIIGAETKAFFPVIAERVHECIPGSEWAVLPGVNHDAPVRDREHANPWGGRSPGRRSGKLLARGSEGSGAGAEP